MFFNNPAIKSLFVCYVVLISSLTFSAEADEKPKPQPLAIDSQMPAFELADFRGRAWSSQEFADKEILAVIFFGTECPLVKLYAPRLKEIQDELGADGVQLVGINSCRQDSLAEINHFARVTNIEFPLLKDPGNQVADAFGASRTPEIFIFNADRKLCYRGRIDDQYTYGRQRPEVQREYMLNAIKKIQFGETPEPQTTNPVGCLIGRLFNEQNSDSVNYSQQISRILQKRCVSCHRPGEIAPFSLTDYDEVVGWAEMMREVVNENRMPPWHANAAHGEFSNDASLTADEKKLINKWVENGAPQGDPADLPEPQKFSEGWRIGEPDFVVAMDKTPFQVPATGVIEYKYFVVDPNFKADKFITAAEIRIGNRAVVHHVIVGLDDEHDGPHGSVNSEWITACAPGSPPLELPAGFAKVIPAGSKLVFQMHYTPNGTAAEDISSVGFKFVDRDQVKKLVGTREIINQDFRIPPGAKNHEVTARRRIGRDALILNLFPHMHLRGKAFRYTAKYPDGTTEILLDVPNYDFNWQNGYHLKQPKLIPAGTVLHCVAHFDNSEDNIANPDPAKTVRWGDQTFDEMMIGYFDMALADQDLTKEDGNND